jgi:hypothetical protein
MPIINVPEDGSCIFRCLTLFLYKELRSAPRFKNGKPKSKHGAKQETEKCYEIRQEIVDYLEVNRDTYTSILYDDTEYYKNIDDRIGSMRMTTEYGGIIELDCAANLYNIKIEIYTDKNAPRLNKIADFNTTARKTCKMFLKDNHYGLIYT